MGDKHWENVYNAHGQLEAEMVRGLLEAQGITVFLSQEGAAHAFALSVGLLGLVQVLVPDSQSEQAMEIVQRYEAAVDTNEPSAAQEDSEEGGDEIV